MENVQKLAYAVFSEDLKVGFVIFLHYKVCAKKTSNLSHKVM